MQTKLKVKNIMFDLDGTLIDSAHDVIQILAEAMDKYKGNRTYDINDIKLGPPLVDMVEKAAPFFSLEERIKIWDDFINIYKTSPLKSTLPFNGVIELLKTLKQSNIKTYIVTYKEKELADKVVSMFFEGLYTDIITPDDISDKPQGMDKTFLMKLMMKKWNFTSDDCIMVGDAKSDIECARAANIFSVGALYGCGEKQDFQNADICVNSIEELSSYILSIIQHA